MKLKSQLKFYLDQRSMTAAELSRKAGVPRQTLSQWLNGTAPRRVEQLKAVADVFNTSIDNLLYGQGLDQQREKVTDLEALMGDGWIGGNFELRIRRIRKEPK